MNTSIPTNSIFADTEETVRQVASLTGIKEKDILSILESIRLKEPTNLSEAAFICKTEYATPSQKFSYKKYVVSSMR